MIWILSGSVSYTHLDVYKRQQYGARPLRRAIQNELEDFLADEYLEGHIKNNDKILLDIEKDKPVIQKERKKKKTE